MPSRQTRIHATTWPRSSASQSSNVDIVSIAGPASTHQSGAELRKLGGGGVVLTPSYGLVTVSERPDEGGAALVAHRRCTSAWKLPLRLASLVRHACSPLMGCSSAAPRCALRRAWSVPEIAESGQKTGARLLEERWR
jgi:hypothetical protein